MKRMNYKRKLISYCVIWSVFLSSLLFYSPINIVLSAPSDPILEVNTLQEGAKLDNSLVEPTGRISDDSIPPDQQSELLESNTETLNKSSQSEQDNATIMKPNIQRANLLFSILENGTRPYTSEMKIIPKGVTDESGYLPAEDMTQVPLDAKIMVVIKESGTLTYTQPLNVSSSKGEKIESIEDLEGTKVLNENGVYKIIFTPTKLLVPDTTYYVYVNPEIKNDLDKKIIPKVFKFKTITLNHQGDIHGNYTNNTNACAYCHSTHNGKDEKLIGGTMGNNPKGICMACHDGTIVPPPENYNQNNEHYKIHETSVDKGYGCTSCHNPHTSWTEENPNKLKSERITNPSHFRVFTYNKASTALGKAEDFSLCLRCHNGTDASDINIYYTDATLVNESGHNFTSNDPNSPLNGQLPCAECHETHGSDNIKSLRAELGNEKRADVDKFKSTGTAFDAANERQFCLKCHNNTTEIYGKTGTFNALNASEEAISGHQQADTQSCSSCHGGASQSARDAAHAPKKGIYVPK